MDKELVNLTPTEYPLYVKRFLQKVGIHLADFKPRRVENRDRKENTYSIDVLTRFKALDVNFVVLIECKHEKKPIKQEDVQRFHSKIQLLGAQKGILFSISEYQRDALEYAAEEGIALVHMVDNNNTYYVRRGPSALILNRDVPKCIALVISSIGLGGYKAEYLGWGHTANVILDKFNL